MRGSLVILTAIVVALAGCTGTEAPDGNDAGTTNEALDDQSATTDVAADDGAEDDAPMDEAAAANTTSDDVADANASADNATAPPMPPEPKSFSESFDLMLTGTRSEGSAQATPGARNCVLFDVADAVVVEEAVATITWSPGPTTGTLQLRYVVGDGGEFVEGGSPLTLKAQDLTMTPGDMNAWLAQLPEEGGVAVAQSFTLDLSLTFVGEDLTASVASCAVAGGG